MYYVWAYYDRRYSGLAESTNARSIDELPFIVWDYLNHGYYVEVKNGRNGKCISFSPDYIEDNEYGLDSSDFRELASPVRKTPIQELNRAFAKSKKNIRI